MVQRGCDVLTVGANISCSNLNFFKKGNYPYKLRTFAPSSVNYKVNGAIESKYIHIIYTTIRLTFTFR